MDRGAAAHRVLEAAWRLQRLGDDPGVFMTCETGGDDEKPCVRLGCQSVRHAQGVHQAIIDLVAATREVDGG